METIAPKTTWEMILEHDISAIAALVGFIIAVFSRMRGNKILERLTVKDSNTPHPCDYRYKD